MQNGVVVLHTKTSFYAILVASHVGTNNFKFLLFPKKNCTGCKQGSVRLYIENCFFISKQYQ